MSFIYLFFFVLFWLDTFKWPVFHISNSFFCLIKSVVGILCFSFSHCIPQHKDFLFSSFNDFYISVSLPILFIYHCTDPIKLSFCFLKGQWAFSKQLFLSFIRQIVDLYFFGVHCWKNILFLVILRFLDFFYVFSLGLISLHLKKQTSISSNVYALTFIEKHLLSILPRIPRLSKLFRNMPVPRFFFPHIDEHS